MEIAAAREHEQRPPHCRVPLLVRQADGLACDVGEDDEIDVVSASRPGTRLRSTRA